MLLKYFSGSVALTALLAAPVSAQVPSWQLPADGSSTARARYADAAQASYVELRRRAYDQGYREGVQEGEKDGRRGDRFAYQDEREFQRADRGYHRNFGDRERYRQIFRDGYIAGYSDGYSRFSRSGRYGGRPGPYGGQGPYAQRGGSGNWGGGVYGRQGSAYYTPAFDNGARDGYEKGQEDARKTRSFDPLRHSWYRSGDRHYENRYGSRAQYKDIYRQGFQRGYERGYQEGRYRW
jgi:flagellar biosynthesis/type III secretory pathway protein FliH